MKKKRKIIIMLLTVCLCTACGLPDAKEESNSVENNIQNNEAQESIESNLNDSAAANTMESETNDKEAHISLIPKMVEGKDFGQTYCEVAYERAPEYAYSAEQWLASGKFDYPFDIYEDTGDMQWRELHARFYVPDEALEQAETYDILQAVKKYPLVSYYGHQEARCVLDAYLGRINMGLYLFTRDDFVTTLLDDYSKSHFLRNGIEKEVGQIQDKGIILEEVMLATDQVYIQMSDEMKKQTIEEVFEKLEERSSGDYYCYDNVSYFFSSICEQYTYSGSSMWYDYLSSEEFGGKYDEYINDYFCYRGKPY